MDLNRTLADPYALFSVTRYDSMRNLILQYRLRWKSPLIEPNPQNWPMKSDNTAENVLIDLNKQIFDLILLSRLLNSYSLINERCIIELQEVP